MANEISFRSSVTVRKKAADGSWLIREGWNDSFRLSMTGAQGPSPGAIAVPTYGVSITFSGIVTPAVCRFWNATESSSHTRIALGVRDPDTALFYPLLSFPRGKGYPVILDPDLFEGYTGPGTSTATEATNNTLWAKAFGADGVLFVGGFEE